MALFIILFKAEKNKSGNKCSMISSWQNTSKSKLWNIVHEIKGCWTGSDKSDKGNDLPWNNCKHEKLIINKATINSRDVLEINLSLRISKIKGP